MGTINKDFIEYSFEAGETKIITPVRIEDMGSTRFFKGLALWDTGAEKSVINASVADALELDTLPFGMMVTATGEEKVGVGATLVFPGNVRRFMSLVTMVRLGCQDGGHREYDCVLGMDVISAGGFSVVGDGKGGFVFRFVFGKGFKCRR